MRKIFLGIIISLIIISFWALISLGFFKEVTIKEATYPELNLIFKEHIGPYHKILPTLEEVEKWAEQNKLDCKKSFAHFLDDPGIKEHSRLKSHVGCWIEEAKNLPLPDPLQRKILPGQKYIVAEFLGSPAIGPFKVYGTAKEYFVEHKWSMQEDVIEIYERYDQDKLKTYYLFKIKN
ncbi:MAG: GyrI-like domain-containing protein [Bdellovibrionaceae bacterium]|nr:GyrI-like domain-containing protein [Pseudobdellovibrionaceae bacterium]